MFADREVRVDSVGRFSLGGLSWEALESGSGMWVRMREVKEAFGVSVLRALMEVRERLEGDIVGGIMGGSWAMALVGEGLGGGVGGRCIRNGFRRGIERGEPSPESVLFCDAVEVSGLWSLMTVPVLLLLSLLLFLSVLTGGRVPVLLGSAMVFSNECESDANDASMFSLSSSMLSLSSGDTGLCWGVSERIDEVTVLGGGGETTPSATS